MLGSFHDAEDAVQETLLAAWQSISSFEGRSSIRTWLYRVATTRSLNMLRSGRRDTQTASMLHGVQLPEPSRLGEVLWLEPYPDSLIDSAPGPEARFETKEAVSLAFIIALQLLPPRQRAVQILRDVLGFHSKEVAEMLDTTEDSVTSALKRARARLQVHRTHTQPQPESGRKRALVERFTRAFEADDVEDLVALLTDDVWFTMPPLPFEWQGRDRARQVLAAVLLPGRRLVATRVNGQPAFGLYLPDSESGTLRPAGLLVLTLGGDKISAITRLEIGEFAKFNLPERPV